MFLCKINGGSKPPPYKIKGCFVQIPRVDVGAVSVARKYSWDASTPTEINVKITIKNKESRCRCLVSGRVLYENVDEAENEPLVVFPSAF